MYYSLAKKKLAISYAKLNLTKITKSDGVWRRFRGQERRKNNIPLIVAFMWNIRYVSLAGLVILMRQSEKFRGGNLSLLELLKTQTSGMLDPN